MRKWIMYEEADGYNMRPAEIEATKRMKDIVSFEADTLWDAMLLAKKYRKEHGVEDK